MQTLGAELAIAHALAVGLHVADALGRGLAAARLGSQRRQQALQSPGLQFRATRFGPVFAVAGEQGLGEVSELLGSVEEVHCCLSRSMGGLFRII